MDLLPVQELIPVAHTNTHSGPLKSIEKVERLLKGARLLLDHKEFGSAFPLIIQVLALDSKHFEGLKLLKELHRLKGNLKEVVQVTKVLCALSPQFETYVDYAEALYLQGCDEEAFENFEKALQHLVFESPKLFDVYKSMGNILVKQGDFDGAEEFYNKAFTMNTQSDALFINLGTLDLQRNDLESAGERFKSALEIKSTSDKAWVGIAMVHQLKGDFDLAQANIEAAMDVNPKNRTAVHLASQWYFKAQNYSKAIAVLENFLSHVECDEELSMVLIHLYCQTHQSVKAQLEIERLLLWSPSNEKVLSVAKELKELYG